MTWPWVLVGSAAMAVGIMLIADGVADTIGAKERDHFRVVVREMNPPVTLFEHMATGQCFLAYHNGGLVSVDKALCADPPTLPERPPDQP